MDASEVWKLFFETRLILDIKTIIRLQKTHRKFFWWKNIKNESRKSNLDNEEYKAMFSVVFWSDAHFGFTHPFFACPIECTNETIQACRKNSIFDIHGIYIYGIKLLTRFRVNFSHLNEPKFRHKLTIRRIGSWIRNKDLLLLRPQFLLHSYTRTP